MQLQDLVKPLDQCSDEELVERLRLIRSNRNTVKPAAKDHVKRAAKKGMQGRINKVENILDGLSEEQRQQLIAQLGG
jgi:hypothetical protein